MIEISHLTKRFGGVTAVDDVSFTVPPGTVTGFLGPNGAGKSTTMRIIMGLERADTGTATVLGKPLREHPAPLLSVGALLDARSLNPARTARASLRVLADTHGLPARRVDEVLDLTGLTEVAGQRAGRYSLGMGQRLGIAAALLGDPRVLVLDEPVNGLDPEGVTWVRQLCRNLAADGRTVLISSHLMSEMAQTADRLVVIGRGRVLADRTLEEFIADVGDDHVRVAAADPHRLGVHLVDAGAAVDPGPEGSLVVRGVDADTVGRVALASGVALTHLSQVRPSLEDAYLRLTAQEVQYHSGGVGEVPPGAPGSVLPSEQPAPALLTEPGATGQSRPIQPNETTPEARS